MNEKQNIADYMQQLGEQARTAAALIAQAESAKKNKALLAIAEALEEHREEIKAENNKDLEQGKVDGLDEALLDRLALNDERIDGMIEGLQQIVTLPDPIGEIDNMKVLPSGLQLGKMRVPLGVIGIIYESRPNVTIDAAALCLKSGNASILRGGKEAINSNQVIAKCVKAGLKLVGLSENIVQVVDTIDREVVAQMLVMKDYIDVLIPRGGKSLTERVANDSRVPVIKHLDGICHVYIDEYCDEQKALDIAYNAKTRRYGVCNAMETLLVSKQKAATVLPVLIQKYVDKGVELRGCEQTMQLSDKVVAATDLDWDTEYLAPILSIKIVESMNEAIEHINRHGSHHTDAIVTENITLARDFLKRIDSSSVMVNSSTAFADGFEYGLGAEIGISTDKIHTRGPVGLEGLTSQKYIVLGDGHTRA
ncbi:MAG: glutamate-5-semialdehyde dehydrogenase [Gammaproteobacteria bacterium]|nr:glutamate-5-semialdehyde dehydrogenase [Gammaproteobacteria bacterium]